MPATYHIDVARKVVFSQGVGRLTDVDILDHQRQLAQDPAFDPTYRQLWDCSAVTEGTVTAAGIRVLAERSVFLPGTRRAIVSPRTAGYGLARMFQTLRNLQGEQTAVFRDLAAARAWLELDD